MSGDNQYVVESNTRLGAAAEQLISDMLALTTTNTLARAYGDLRLDAVAPTMPLPALGSAPYVRPNVDLLQDTHLEDTTASVDSVISGEDASGTTWYSTLNNPSAPCPTAAVSSWAPVSMRLAMYRHEYELPDEVDPDLTGDDGGLDDSVTPADPFMSGEDVKKGDKRAVTIFGTGTKISSKSARTTAGFDLAELLNWNFVSQSAFPSYYANSLVIAGFRILAGVDTWKSNATRTTVGAFDAAEKVFWTKL